MTPDIGLANRLAQRACRTPERSDRVAFRLEVVPALPRNATGKLQKMDLRNQFKR